MKKIYSFIALLFIAAAAQAQCTAAFSTTNAGNTYSFTDLSTTSSGNIVSWLWTFGDQSAPSTQQNPQHSYDVCGNYIVTLNILTSSFCSASFSDTILVNSGFSGSFTATVDTTTGTVNFQATPASNLVNYSWDFGDASTGTGAAPSHTYASSGNYNVCLTMADTGNVCSDTVCTMITVYIAPASCNATFTNNLLGAGNESFNATPFNLNWSYSWDFGDSNTGNGFFTTHQYTASGTYTVCLTVNDSSNGCSSTFCDTVNIVLPVSCPPTFTANGLNGIYVFTASPFSIQNTYSWDFGDSSPLGNGFVANHTYAASGTYTVCLTMTTPSGCTGTFCDTVTVVISGINESSSTFPVAMYPNPASDQLQLDYQLAGASEATIMVMDLSGRIMLVKNETQNAGPQHESIDLSSLAPGTYLLQLKTENGTANKVFVKD